MGTGIGFAFAALGNLIVGSVPQSQTGVATGMNTVMRTLGGAIGAQIAATFVANNLAHGIPDRTGFVDAFVMAAGLLALSLLTGLLVPGRRQATVLVTHELERGPRVVALGAAGDQAAS
jgi:hypothetical protein